MSAGDKDETRGRKPLKTPGGKRIRKVVCNMTIPQDLYDFLVERGVSRSKLFVELALMYKYDDINPCCFKKGREETSHGVYCIHCSDPPYRHAWLSFKNCPSCGNQFYIQPHGDEEHYGKVGCYRKECMDD